MRAPTATGCSPNGPKSPSNDPKMVGRGGRGVRSPFLVIFKEICVFFFVFFFYVSLSLSLEEFLAV